MFMDLPFCRMPVTVQGDDSHLLSCGVIYCSAVGASNLMGVGSEDADTPPQEEGLDRCSSQTVTYTCTTCLANEWR